MSMFSAPLRHNFSRRVKTQVPLPDVNDSQASIDAAQDCEDQSSEAPEDNESDHYHSRSGGSDGQADDESRSPQATLKRNKLSEQGTPARHRSLRYQHIDVLVTLLHRSILDSDWPRAEHAYALLIRCKGIDIRLCYDLGLEILENVDSTGNKAAELLSRLIVAYPPIRPRRGKAMFDRAEKFVPLLVEHRMSHKQYKLALQELEGWLLVPPYKDNIKLWNHYTQICEALINIAADAGNREEVSRLTRKKDKATTHISE